MKCKICFRADASAQIGYGHFIRLLALADMLKDDFECVFYTVAPSPYQISEMQKVCPFVPLSEETKFESFLMKLGGGEIVILDNYFFTTEYQREIKKRGCKLVCVDDMHDKHYVADMIINHALTDTSLFDCEPYTKFCLGLDYALLREPFRKPLSYEKREKTVVVNFGGADPFGITERIVTMLLQMSISYHIVVILGDKVHLSDKNRQKVTIKKNLSAEQMAEIFETSSVGILAASTVCIEAISRHLPLIIGYHVNNQIEGYRKLVTDGYALPLGLLQDVEEKTIKETLSLFDSFSFNHFDSSKIKNNYLQQFSNIAYD